MRRCCLVLALVCAGLHAAAGSAQLPRAADGRFVSWREHRIDDEGLGGPRLRGADGLALADLDRDGFLDVVSVHEDSSHLRVSFGSPDPQRWRSVTLAAGRWVDGVEDVAIGDVNGDGYLDLVVGAERGHVALLLAPARTRRVGRWRPVLLQATRGRGSWIRVALADLDGDGRPEILAANKGSPDQDAPDGSRRRRSFSYFRLEGRASDPRAWREIRLGRAHVPINIRPVDLDGDGDVDVVASSWGDERIVWFENDGRAGFAEHLLHEGAPRTVGFMLEFADLDRDGRTDVVAGSGPRAESGDLFWLRQPERTDDRWTAHAIGTLDPDKPTGLRLLDIDGDGRLDLFVGGYSWGDREREPDPIRPQDPSGRLAWFRQPEDPKAPWTRHDVSRRRRGMFDRFLAADVNQDGLIDLLTTRGNSGLYDGVLWLEQRREREAGHPFEPARAEDSPEVPLPE